MARVDQQPLVEAVVQDEVQADLARAGLHLDRPLSQVEERRPASQLLPTERVRVVHPAEVQQQREERDAAAVGRLDRLVDVRTEGVAPLVPVVWVLGFGEFSESSTITVACQALGQRLYPTCKTGSRG